MDILERVPPNSLDAERAVLGAMLLDKEAVARSLEILSYKHFYVPNHQIVFKTIWDLFNQNSPVDLVTVSESLKGQGVLEDIGGYMYLLDLSESVPTTANIEQYARIVEEKYIRRELIKASSEISDMSYSGSEDISRLLDNAERTIFSIGQKRFTRDLVHIKELLVENFESISQEYPEDNQPVSLQTGISTGIGALDEYTNGLNPSDLIIIAARPAMGKTSFCLNLAANIALKENMPIAIFSLEMSKEQLTQRIVCSEAEISNYHFRVGNVPSDKWGKLTDTIGKLYKAPIYIDDSGSLTPIEIRAKVRRLKAEYKKLGAVIVDYLQLMDMENAENRVQEIAKITRSLKRLARELDVPVIALSQLSRTVEQRQNKRPQLSDLRESGCLTGDTLVLNSNTGERIPIIDLFNNNVKTMPTLSLTNNLKLKEHNISNVFYSGKKQVFEIKTKSGRKIKASANHPFLNLSGWNRLDKLKIGEKIAVSRNICISNYENTLNDDELILLAHLTGDGCILPKQPYHYTTQDISNLDIVNKTAKNLFNIESRIVKQNNYHHIYLKSPYKLTRNIKHPITLWFDKLDLKRVKSYEKVLPNSLFNCNEDKIKLFLKHLWATDGNISWINNVKNNCKKNVSIYYATSSEKLSEQVQHLLLRCNIRSDIHTIKSKKGYRNMYHVCIQLCENKITFLKEIGCYGKKGEEIPEMLLYLNEIKSNPNKDIIPKDAWDLIIRPIQVKSGISWRKVCNGLDMSYCGTSLFNSGISRNRMEKLYNIFKHNNIKNLAESDILWDEILSITPLGIEDVYDLTVDNVHNFVANDFIVHNSIEQDADIVMFIYRDEYYNPDSDKKRTAELIIAKHRNGPVGTIELYFDASLTKFSGLENFEAG